MPRMCIFLVIIISILNSGITYAQGLKCGKKFEQITSQCITRNFQDKLKKEVKQIIPSDSNNILDKTYIYKTSAGNFGKLKIVSSLSNKTECTLYLEATTYINGNSYNPTGTLSIKNEYNIWSSDTVSFDKRGGSDFSLVREDGKCKFTTNEAQLAYYGSTKEDSLLSGRETLFNAALFLIGLSVFLVARSIFVDEEKFKAQEKLEDADDENNNAPPPDIVLRYSRPFFKRYFSPIVKGMKNKKALKDKYKRKLASSGLSKELTPEDFFAFKLFLIIGFPILFIIVREFLEESWPLSAIPALGLVGFFYPDIWVNGKIDQRKADITQNMPFIVDMLALSVEAGLDFVAAMTKVIDKAPSSALTEEFETMIKETKVGASRAEGLRQLAWRCDTIQVSSFCATLIAADSVGANIGPILKTLSAEMRQKRSADAEKKGATAATKILFPMMLLIMPSVAIIIMAPIMLEMMLGGG
jgi:tight adherence protein C